MCVIKKDDISAGSAESIFVLTFIKLLIVSLMKCCISAMLNQGRTVCQYNNVKILNVLQNLNYVEVHLYDSKISLVTDILLYIMSHHLKYYKGPLIDVFKVS